MQQIDSQVPLVVHDSILSNSFIVEPLSEVVEPLSEVVEPLSEVDKSKIHVCQYVGVLDFFMPLNLDPSKINDYELYFKIIQKPIKIPLLGCLSGIIISSIAIPFPFSMPLILAFSGFVLTLIIYRLRVYKNL